MAPWRGWLGRGARGVSMAWALWAAACTGCAPEGSTDDDGADDDADDDGADDDGADDDGADDDGADDDGADDDGADDDGGPSFAPGDPLEHLGSDMPGGAVVVEVLDLAVAHPHVWSVGQGGAWVYDVSDPSAPVVAGELHSPSLPRADRVALGPGTYAGMTAVPGGPTGSLYLVDAGDPEAPAVLWSRAGLDLPVDIAAVGEYGYLVCARAAGLQSWRLSGDTLVLAHTASGVADCSAVAVSGTVAAVGLGSLGVALVDVADPEAVALLGEVEVPGYVNQVVWDGERVWVAAGSAGVALVDAHDPAAPSVASRYDGGWSVFGVAAAGDVAFAAGMTDLFGVDFADPAAPYLRAVEWAPDIAMGVSTDGDLVYLADWNLFDVYRFHPDLGGAEVEVEPRSGVGLVSYGGGPPEGEVQVSNAGFAPLEVALGASDPDLAVEPAALTLAPGDAESVALVYGGGGSAVEATLEIATNDPDEALVSVPVYWGTGGLAVGSPAPDFTLSRLDGSGTVTLSDAAAAHEAVLLYFFTTW